MKNILENNLLFEIKIIRIMGKIILLFILYIK